MRAHDPALRLLAGAVLAVAAAQPASAQSFLESLARRAAEQAAAAAVARAQTAIAEAGSEQAETEEPAPVRQASAPRAAAQDGPPPARTAAPAPSTGPAPWPVNAGAQDLGRPGELEFSAETKALAEAFDEFGRVSCTGCEGGRTYDSWAQHSIKLGSEYGAWDKKLGGLALSETLDWTGAESKGRITVVSETPVSGFRCKQLKWELFKGQARAERPGLVCFGKSSPYSASDTWVEVF